MTNTLFKARLQYWPVVCFCILVKKNRARCVSSICFIGAVECEALLFNVLPWRLYRSSLAGLGLFCVLVFEVEWLKSSLPDSVGRASARILCGSL